VAAGGTLAPKSRKLSLKKLVLTIGVVVAVTALGLGASGECMFSACSYALFKYTGSFITLLP
jgi:hypothetical protein